MDYNKFGYFLNAVHYCLWLNDMKFGDCMGKVVGKQLSLVFKYLFTKEDKEKYNERLLKEQKKVDKYLYERETGWHIGWANHGLAIFTLVILRFSLFSVTWGCFQTLSRC